MTQSGSARTFAEAGSAPLALGSLPEAGPIRGWRGAVKAAADRLGAFALILFLLPLFLAVPLLVLADGGGSVLFRQTRYGEGCRTFRILKFRTLRPAAADPTGARQVAPGDGRASRIGAFLRATSLDEIPQLFNVLLGDMSLVGPRPHPVEMRTEGRLGEEISPLYMLRHAVKPGMTGLAQIHGRRGPTRRVEDLLERLDDDIRYVTGWSLLLDLKILLLTPVALLAPGLLA